jgi:hypothetical protein
VFFFEKKNQKALLSLAALKKRGSFLKKRTKKLLLLAPRFQPTQGALVLPVTDKSFLLLFFKKEVTFSFHVYAPHRAARG